MLFDKLEFFCFKFFRHRTLTRWERRSTVAAAAPPTAAGPARRTGIGLVHAPPPTHTASSSWTATTTPGSATGNSHVFSPKPKNARSVNFPWRRAPDAIIWRATAVPHFVGSARGSCLTTTTAVTIGGNAWKKIWPSSVWRTAWRWPAARTPTGNFSSFSYFTFFKFCISFQIANIFTLRLK